MSVNLHIVPQEYFKMSDYDLRLPKLGVMKFAMCDADDGGVFIMYIKKRDFVEGRAYSPEDLCQDVTPYCYAKVKLTELEKTLHRKFYNKICRKIDKLRAWVIQQDVLLSEIQSTNRNVKI